MFRKILVTAVIAASLAAPAFAATTYYVEKDSKTNKCSVATTKPDGKTEVMVGTATYTTKTAAEAALKAAADCK
jgi:hypothetical protein